MELYYTWPMDIYEEILCCVEIFVAVFDCLMWLTHKSKVQHLFPYGQSLQFHACIKIRAVLNQSCKFLSYWHKLSIFPLSPTMSLRKITKTCSKKINKIYRKVPALNLFFSNIPDLGFATLLKEKLNHMCFLGKWGNILEETFYITPTNGCFYMLL